MKTIQSKQKSQGLLSATKLQEASKQIQCTQEKCKGKTQNTSTYSTAFRVRKVLADKIVVAQVVNL